MEQHPKQLFSATIVFFEGAENDYEVTISARKITSKNNVLAKSVAVTDVPEKKVNPRHPRPKKKVNVQHPQLKNTVLTSSGRNDRSCKGGCRCVSFYDLHQRVTENDIVRLCSDFGLVVESVKSMWNHPDKKSVFVWMATQKQANDIVKEYDGRELDGKTLRVIKGHFSNHHKEQKDSKINCEDDQRKKERVERFGFVPRNPRVGTKLDKELYPKRKETFDKFSKERAEKLDRELDEYMQEKESDEELDHDIDEYLHMKITTQAKKEECLECEDCGKCFGSEQTLIKHFENMHSKSVGQAIPSTKGSNMFSENNLDILKRDERKNKEAARKLLCSSSDSSRSESVEPPTRKLLNSLGNPK
jgi:hypothetical protein